MMDKIKEVWTLILGSSLVVEGSSRTYAKVPTWLAVLAALSSLKLTVVTVVLAVAFGMRARLVKA